MGIRKSLKKPAPKTKTRAKASARKRPTKSNGKPVGLDLGTSTVVAARQNGRGVRSQAELNAFIELPRSKFTEQILDQNEIDFVRDNGHLIVFGNGAFKFANMFNAETRRPMRHGLVNAGEPYAQKLLEAIVEKLVGKPQSKGAPLCFSVPGPPQSAPSSLVYHEALMKQMLDNMGFEASPINEGLAVVFSELEKENFSGIGISFGGGLTNVCLAYLSVPVFTFAVDKGGDDVDEAVGEVTGETATRVKAIKEEGLDLSHKGRTKVAGALQIYYDDLIATVVEGIGGGAFARRPDAQTRQTASGRPRWRHGSTEGFRHPVLESSRSGEPAHRSGRRAQGQRASHRDGTRSAFGRAIRKLIRRRRPPWKTW